MGWGRRLPMNRSGRMFGGDLDDLMAGLAGNDTLQRQNDVAGASDESLIGDGAVLGMLGRVRLG
jgi:hypothetical protein